MHPKKPNTIERGPALNKLQAPTRRGSKPQVEKKRRARINKSLSELQALLIDDEMVNHQLKTRIEKADILEKAVAHLKRLREKDNSTNKPQVAESPPPLRNENSVHHSPLKKFNGGYIECATKASSYLLEVEKVDQGLHDRLKSHLMFVYEEINMRNISPSPSAVSLNASNDEDSNESSSSPRGERSSSETDDSERLQAPESPLSYSGFTPESNKVVRVIPGRLPNGQLAFLLPHEQFSQFSERDLAFRSDSETYNPFMANYPNPPLAHYGLSSYQFAERQRQLPTMNGPDPQFPFQLPSTSYIGGFNFGHATHWRPW